MKHFQVIKTTQANHNKTTLEDLKHINALTRRSLDETKLYTFSSILCDNEIDRDFEQFSDESLESLKDLFTGVSGIFDHIPTVANQTARIYFTQTIIDHSRKNSLGQPYKYLIAKSYMVKSEKNKDLILEIDAGIKKEISIGCAVKYKICSICSADHNSRPCLHKPGKKYIVDNIEQLCYLSLREPIDAYEWSFVTIPAQINAGIIKNFPKKDYVDFLSITDEDPIKITKSMNQTHKGCLLSSSAVNSLVKYISNLQKESQIVHSFLSDIRKDVKKMLSISQHSLTSSMIDNIVDNLSDTELKIFKSNLIKDLNVSCISPQLTPQTPTHENFCTDENNPFII